MAVAMDLGNPNSPYGSIHPTDKTDVGFRLGLAGLSIAYGKDKYYTGPLVSKIQKYVRGSTVYLQVFFKSLNKKIELRNSDGFQVYGCIQTHFLRMRSVYSSERFIEKQIHNFNDFRKQSL